MSQPTAGGTIGLRTVVCYAISGSAREPELVLEVTLLLPQGLATSVPVSVGRGAATVDLGGAGAPPGRYNLRFQLIVNGERLEGLAVTIPSVTISAGTAPGSCA